MPKSGSRAEQPGGGGDPVRGRRRIARSVGQEHPVEAAGRDVSGRRLRRDHGGVESGRRGHTQDVPLDPEVVDGDP